MLTDDEKFLHNPNLSIEQCLEFSKQNAMDIIAMGFDLKKTFIFSDLEFMRSGHAGAFQDNVLTIAKRTTMSQIKGKLTAEHLLFPLIDHAQQYTRSLTNVNERTECRTDSALCTGTFGFKEHNNIGEFYFPAMQSATAFATSFPFIFGYDVKKVSKVPCLIPCAIDQDPYFRQCRDSAPKMKLLKPALLHSVFLPSLRGSGGKMSASDSDSSIFLSDTDKQIKKKIGLSFSGGQETLEEHKEQGGRTEVDIAYQYLTFFLEDDEKLEELRKGYEEGVVSTGQMKAACIKELQDYVGAFRERRKAVTDQVRKDFMRPRQLTFRGMPSEDEQKAS